jgi:soluble lytic murein transglycosylase-like protein
VTPYRSLIEHAAARYRLDPNLVEAVCIAESSGLTSAFRYEPGFYTRYLKGKPEYAGMIPQRVSSSYGLLQVMYTTAQQYGYQEPPEHLFVPETGLKYGCLHLAAMVDWAGGNVRQALAGYNGGKGNWKADQPQRYASRVLALYRSVELAHPAETV